MSARFRQGDIVTVRRDLDGMTLYHSSCGCALQLADHEQVKFAGTVAIVHAVSSSGLRYVLSDARTGHLLPGFWVDELLTPGGELPLDPEQTARKSIDLGGVTILIPDYVEREAERVGRGRKPLKEAATKFESERHQLQLITEIAKLSRSALSTVKEGRSARSIFRKISETALSGVEEQSAKQSKWEKFSALMKRDMGKGLLRLLDSCADTCDILSKFTMPVCLMHSAAVFLESNTFTRYRFFEFMITWVLLRFGRLLLQNINRALHDC